MPHLIFILFLFALGACIGSFLNVVVWRLPRGESLVRPPSHCPKCGKLLKWYDNLPIIGWIKLGGKCRFCSQPISPRYPIVEAVTGLLFVLYYVMFFILQIGPCLPAGDRVTLSILDDWPMYGLYMFAVAALLAASLIYAELFIIPLEIPWLMAGVAFVVHGIIDRPSVPGALNLTLVPSAIAAGAAIGLVVSLGLWRRGWLPTSFPQGEPMLEVDHELYAREAAEAKARGETVDPLPPEYTIGQVRGEILKEVIFLLPPVVLAIAFGVAVAGLTAMGSWWAPVLQYHWLTGLLGSVLGACAGAFIVWFFRIFGTLAFGRVAMGLGDVHLMFGVGAVIGATGSVAAFFIAPFFALLFHVWLLLIRGKRELPYGPYLSLATAVVFCFSCPIAGYLSPGMEGLGIVLRRMIGLS
jgi:leader peptidase (prepilin peptidase)/N-methyltransferase